MSWHLFLIDLLLKPGCKLYYCGDIDPEGLEIADRVLARGRVRFFPGMTVEDDYRSISDEVLAEQRMKKLNKIGNRQLRELVALLRKEKKAGYQEHLINWMALDIRENHFYF